MRVPNYTQQELCNEVYKAVLEASQPLTRLEICWAISRKKSPHIVNMILGLRDGGYLQEIPDHDKHGRPAFRYRVDTVATSEKACPDEKIDIPA